MMITYGLYVVLASGKPFLVGDIFTKIVHNVLKCNSIMK